MGRLPDIGTRIFRTGPARGGLSGSANTERRVRETWRHYYVARPAEAQFAKNAGIAAFTESIRHVPERS